MGEYIINSMNLKIKKNVRLAKYTSFHIGGTAEFFAEIKSIQELKKAINYAEDKKINIFILGGGSNILLPDNHIDMLVLKMNIRGITLKDNIIHAGAGEVWDKVVANAVSKNLNGIENLSLIPGSVGGAVYQNIGAYGAELKDTLKFVDVFDTKLRTIKKISKNECGFGYRTSMFQRQEGRKYIILGASLKLRRDLKFNLKYPDLINYFSKKTPKVKDIRQAIIRIRKSKLVYPTKSIGTVGSFFKNPIISQSKFKKINSKFPDIKGRKVDKNMVKLFAGQLIEKAGWKNKRIGKVGVSPKHALVLISYNGAKARDIRKLSKKIQNSVKNMFNIYLEPEIKILI